MEIAPDQDIELSIPTMLDYQDILRSVCTNLSSLEGEYLELLACSNEHEEYPALKAARGKVIKRLVDLIPELRTIRHPGDYVAKQCQAVISELVEALEFGLAEIETCRYSNSNKLAHLGFPRRQLEQLIIELEKWRAFETERERSLLDRGTDVFKILDAVFYPRAVGAEESRSTAPPPLEVGGEDHPDSVSLQRAAPNCQQTLPIFANPAPNRPTDLIAMRVAVVRFVTSRGTIKRAVKNGKLTSYRRPNDPKNAEHILSESALAALYEPRK